MKDCLDNKVKIGDIIGYVLKSGAKIQFGVFAGIGETTCKWTNKPEYYVRIAYLGKSDKVSFKCLMRSYNKDWLNDIILIPDVLYKIDNPRVARCIEVQMMIRDMIQNDKFPYDLVE